MSSTLQVWYRLTFGIIDYDPANGRANLDILVGSYVATLVTEPGASVAGVNVARVNSTSTRYKFLRSDKEVILATGAIHTAQILQLSGIGPADLLEALGIDIVADLPGVGANFQDHPTNNGFSFQCAFTISSCVILDEFYRRLTCISFISPERAKPQPESI